MNVITCKKCGNNEFKVFGKVLKCEYCKTCYSSNNIGDYEYFLKAMGFEIKKQGDLITITHIDNKYFSLQCINDIDENDFKDALKWSGKEEVYSEGINLC